MTVAATTPLAELVSVEDAREELSKFFQIADMADKAPEMFSTFIDAEWHRMLESKDDYTRFCMDSVGHPVGHQEGPGYGVVSWVDLYHDRFGTLPGAWFASAEGIVDMAAYESYLDSRSTTAVFNCADALPCKVGNPPALVTSFDCQPTSGDPDFITSWDCTPTTGDPDLKPKGKPGFITAWDCTPTTGDPDYMKTSPDPILPPVPDKAAPAQ